MSVAELSMEELEKIIEKVAIRTLAVRNKLISADNAKSGRSEEEILASIKRNRWTPPDGAPTNLELLREDRDR
jgi:hypothetical protein